MNNEKPAVAKSGEGKIWAESTAHAKVLGQDCAWRVGRPVAEAEKVRGREGGEGDRSMSCREVGKHKGALWEGLSFDPKESGRPGGLWVEEGET